MIATSPSTTAQRTVGCGRPGSEDRRLRGRQVVRYDLRAPSWFGCLDGVLWLTVDGELRDFVLTSGMWVEVVVSEPVVIMALEESTLRCGELPRAGLQGHPQPGRAWAWLRRISGQSRAAASLAAFPRSCIACMAPADAATPSRWPCVTHPAGPALACSAIA